MDSMPNYLNPSNIDPARAEPVRSSHVHDQWGTVTAYRADTITRALEMYQELFRRVKSETLITDIYEPGRAVKAARIVMSSGKNGGDNKITHVIEATGKIERFAPFYPQKPTSGLIEEGEG